MRALSSITYPRKQAKVKESERKKLKVLYQFINDAWKYNNSIMNDSRRLLGPVPILLCTSGEALKSKKP